MINDVRKIQALFHVAERGTITAAAEALGYTPSAVSQQLSSLEAELGAPVLERRGRNVVITDAGRLLLQHGREAIASLERAQAAVAELHGEPTGPVRIGALSSATASIIPLALRSVLAEHPRIEPEVIIHPLDQNVEELRLGSIDIAVDQSYELAPHSLFAGLHETVLLSEPLLLLSPADDPIDEVSHAVDRDWISSPANCACGRSTRSVTARFGFEPRVRYETDDHFATVRLVSAGLAVAVLPALALLHREPNVHVVEVPGAHRRISAVTRPAARDRPAVTAVIDHLLLAAEHLDVQSLAA